MDVYDNSQDRWVFRESPDQEPPEDSWISVGVEMDPTRLAEGDPFHSQPPKRQALEYVGGVDKVIEVATSSDRVRAFFMRKDLRWINKVMATAGLELAVLRVPKEE